MQDMTLRDMASTDKVAGHIVRRRHVTQML